MRQTMRMAAIILLCSLSPGLMAADDSAATLSDLRQKASDGLASAQYELSLRLSRMGKQSEEALNWMQKAAEQGLADAEYALGVLYEEGRAGYERNLLQASAWFDRAARHGYKQAQSAIGSLYWNRAERTSDDRATACAWFTLARDEANIAECNRVLSLDQKRLAETKFEELKETYPY